MSTEPASHNCFRIWQFSDTHLFADSNATLYGVNSDDLFRRIITAATKKGGDAMLSLFTGDLVHDGSVAGYQRLLDIIEMLGVNAHCLPGNHDSSDIMHAILSGPRVSCGAHVLYKNWLIILVDTTLSGENAGQLSATEVSRIESLIAINKRAYVLLAMHHPPVKTSMEWLDKDVTLTNPDAVDLLADKYPAIRGVVWGHAHQEYERYRDGVLWAGCPSTMAQFKPGVVEFELDTVAPGFRTLDLYPDGNIQTQVIRLN